MARLREGQLLSVTRLIITTRMVRRQVLLQGRTTRPTTIMPTAHRQDRLQRRAGNETFDVEKNGQTGVPMIIILQELAY